MLEVNAPVTFQMEVFVEGEPVLADFEGYVLRPTTVGEPVEGVTHTHYEIEFKGTFVSVPKDRVRARTLA